MKHIVCISGFSQNQGGHRDNGVLKLYHWLKGTLAEIDEAEVYYRSWNHNWNHFAKFIHYGNDAFGSDSAPTPATVIIVAYSYGAGWGAMRLARELQALGIDVRDMVLSDPVYRSAWWLLAWRSMIPSRQCQGKERTKIGLLFRAVRYLLWRLGQALPWLVPEITVPNNVERLWIARQDRNLPQGHKLSARCTAFLETYDYSVRHAAMDDLQEFHFAAKRRAAA